jgi:uncharacterized protein YbjT (DUF2867 family)
MDRPRGARLGGGMTILIVGGSGKTGRRVARRLAGHDVRAVSRATGFDLADPKTWVLDGITAAYLVVPMGEPLAGRFVGEVVAAGARRLVLLSAPAAGAVGHPLHAAEQAVRGADAEWTVLRPSWFAQNFSEAFWLPGILAGDLAVPDGRVPFVDAEDIAAVAVAALTEDGHHGRVYDLTGPRALSFGEATAVIGQATGRTIRHVDVDPEVHIGRQVAQGMPPAVARLLTDALRDHAEPADGVPRALGRSATSFEEFVVRTAAEGCWGAPRITDRDGRYPG